MKDCVNIYGVCLHACLSVLCRPSHMESIIPDLAPSPGSFSFNFPHERGSSHNFLKGLTHMDTRRDWPQINVHKNTNKREKREQHSEQKHQHGDHQSHHKRTTEKSCARGRRGLCRVMWPRKGLSPWALSGALSVCGGLLGHRGWAVGDHPELIGSPWHAC